MFRIMAVVAVLLVISSRINLRARVGSVPVQGSLLTLVAVSLFASAAVFAAFVGYMVLREQPARIALR
jgi:hypothetical protein